VALNIEIDQYKGCVVAHLSGELDLTVATETQDRFAELIAAPGAAGPLRLVIDLTQVFFCDSTGIGVLAWILRAVHKAHGQLALVAPRGILVTNLIEVTQLSRVIPTHPTVEAACQYLTGSPPAATGTTP